MKTDRRYSDEPDTFGVARRLGYESIRELAPALQLGVAKPEGGAS